MCNHGNDTMNTTAPNAPSMIYIKPNALLHHSDQGSQYTSEPFRLLL